MSAFLAFLKFGGLIVSAVLAVLAALTQSHDQIAVDGRKKLNRWGQWAFALLICSFSVSLGAQFLELRQRQNDSEVARLRTEAQLLQASEVLQSLHAESMKTGLIIAKLEEQSQTNAKELLAINQILTRFSSIDVTIWYEVPREGKEFEALYSDIDKFARQEHPALDKSGRFEEVHSKGYLEIDSRECQDAAFIQAIPSLQTMRRFLSSLQQGSAHISIFKGFRPHLSVIPIKSSDAADLSFDADTSSLNTTLCYSLSHKLLFVKWSDWHSKREEWISNGRIVGLHNLGGANLIVGRVLGESRDAALNELCFRLKAAFVEIRFDGRRVLLKDFSNLGPAGNLCVFGTKFPPYEIITANVFHYDPVQAYGMSLP